MIIGPDHPYFAGGWPMDAPSVGVGQNDGFVFQARAFLEEVVGIDEADSLPRNALRSTRACTTWRSSRRSPSPPPMAAPQ